MPSFGSGGSSEVKEDLEIWDDLAYSRYKKSNAIHRLRSLEFEELIQEEFDSLVAFFETRKQAAGSDFEFYFYDFSQVDEVDESGNSTTGRHTAIFISAQLQWTRSGPCTYDASAEVLLLD